MNTRDQSLIWIYGQESITESYHLPSLVAIGTKIVDMFLVCHVISQDSVTEMSCGFMDDSPLW